MKVQLNQEQEQMKMQIQELFNEAMGYFAGRSSDIPSNRMEEIIKMMGDVSHDLHMQLEPKPTHHKYMIQNRGMEPEHPNFYYQIHAIEDLLKYLEDSNANNDPADITLNEKFNFKVFTRRWDHYDLYRVVRNEKGWMISHMSHKGQGGKNAEPILSYILRHDSVSYPQNLPDIMEDIWLRAEEEGLTKEEVQSMLNEVAEWISIVEKNYPSNITR
ncbi:hypothetical protein [Bacillus cereus]|uniref:hypothetical protein n=1 Tax=Bacillus cereus TaxID=1396 RepID=UPI000BF28245|nr:hypothetical protein [Bacillus cereus]MCU5243409.1 hypothetical protein [Bacillus cereus]PEV31096.1 hypothetical protein CN430_03095 [Bacillus cereus]PEY46695.1 hypothetical protein CN348_28910 [Bacillus cereus]PFE39129.1 hypothetical protein CN294_18285 [Bacillus cereus]PFK43721.1 hypothetical protein COJ20_06900 [Bacillus cereus]